MSSSRIERFGNWLGLTDVDSALGPRDASGHDRSTSIAARIGFLAGWAVLAVVVFMYLQMSATGEDGIGGYLPLLTAGLTFSTGSLFTLSVLDRAESGE